MKLLYWTVAAVVVAMSLMNLIRIEPKNPAIDRAQAIEAYSPMPTKVAGIFRRACQDCHSEQTTWPWYSKIAPTHWLVTADIYAAREHLNLSRWGRYTPEERTDRLIAVCEMVASNKMPLWYYKPAHYPSAWLTDSDKQAVCDWVKSEVQRSALTQSLGSEKGAVNR